MSESAEIKEKASLRDEIEEGGSSVQSTVNQSGISANDDKSVTPCSKLPAFKKRGNSIYSNSSSF